MLLTEEDRWEIRGHDEQQSAPFTSDTASPECCRGAF